MVTSHHKKHWSHNWLSMIHDGVNDEPTRWYVQTGIKIVIMVSDFNSTLSRIENNNMDQFRYTQHLVLFGPIRDDDDDDPQVTDHTLQSITEHCYQLQLLSLSNCHWESWRQKVCRKRQKWQKRRIFLPFHHCTTEILSSLSKTIKNWICRLSVLSLLTITLTWVKFKLR